jgi:hypothetical protein
MRELERVWGDEIDRVMIQESTLRGEQYVAPNHAFSSAHLAPQQPLKSARRHLYFLLLCTALLSSSILLRACSVAPVTKLVLPNHIQIWQVGVFETENRSYRTGPKPL